jgi:hypothetical protein
LAELGKIKGKKKAHGGVLREVGLTKAAESTYRVTYM